MFSYSASIKENSGCATQIRNIKDERKSLRHEQKDIKQMNDI